MRQDSPFLINLAEIPPEGLVRTLDLSGEFARTAFASTEADADSAELSATLELTQKLPDVYAQGTLAGTVTLLCSRCLGSAPVEIASRISVLFVPRGRESDEIDADGPDIVPYIGDELDLGDMLREEMLLALPMAPLCSESCLGLCPTCGKDLNEGPCGHAPAVSEYRWSTLKNVKVEE